MKTNTKDIIDAADKKYSIANLKLETDAAHVESTAVPMDNALLYADAKNCALLKEAVTDFLADNHKEAAKNVSFSVVPGQPRTPMSLNSIPSKPTPACDPPNVIHPK